MDRRRALSSVGKIEVDSPYAFYLNIELKQGEAWRANAEQLVELQKMFAILFEVHPDGGSINPEDMPPEFDLRLNGERQGWNFYWDTSRGGPIDVYISMGMPVGIWFGNVTIERDNPVLDSFVLAFLQ